MSDLVFWIWWLDYVEVKSIDHVSKKKKIQLIMFLCWPDWFWLCLGLGNR